MSEPAGDPADRHHTQQRRHGPADATVTTVAGERSAIGEHRSMGDEIEDQVVRLVAASEIVAAVVDHLVGAERPHELELAGVVDSGHVRPKTLGQLDGERARATAAPVDQHPTPDRCAARSLQCDRPGLGDRRCLCERQLCRLVSERRFGHDRILGEAALERQVVAVHLVTGVEPSDRLTDDVDAPGDVRAERAARRRAQPAEAGVQRRAAQGLPVTEVDRRCGNPDTHLTGGGRRQRHIVNPEYLRLAVPVVDDRPHVRRPTSTMIRPTSRTYLWSRTTTVEPGRQRVPYPQAEPTGSCRWVVAQTRPKRSRISAWISSFDRVASMWATNSLR